PYRRRNAARPRSDVTTGQAPADSPMPEIDDLPDKPGHLIRLAQQRSVATFAKAARRYSITGVQHIIMVALHKYPDVDLSTLAGIVALDRSTTGAVVARLGERGLVAVEPSPS